MSYHPKVLIVDDNDVMRTLLRALLRDEAYQVVGEARNGLQALEQIASLQPDLVCLDVIMPDLDGLETLRAIRRDHPRVVVVMVTGMASVENVQEALKLGAAGFVIKPFNAAKVLENLARAWANRSHFIAAEEGDSPAASEKTDAPEPDAAPATPSPSTAPDGAA